MDFCYIKLDRLILLKSEENLQRGEIVALAKSMAKLGVLSPITVKRLLHTDRYEVISGTKRIYAARLARLISIPALVIDAETDSAIARATLKRGETHDFFAEAETIRNAMLSQDLSAEELSDLTGYTVKQIVSFIRLTKMGDFEREFIRRNKICIESTCEIAQFDDICRRTELLGEVVRMRLNPHEVESLCEKERRGKRSVSKAKAIRTPKLRDIRIFDNTVNRALSLLKSAGVVAKIDTEKVSGATEYKIRIEN